MYQLTDNGVIRLSDNASIPNAEGNRDWQEYQVWLADGNSPLPVPPPTEEQLRSIWKAERAAAVEAIVVTTAAGNIFDGDETSQARMARAILGLQVSGADATVTWVLSDNSVIQATGAELQEALALAGAEQARLWVAA
ncbi:hypothetical protein N7320_02165 [Stutzerimonas stutzeri]|uniref:DUF4376 domain-containing protein n=1 Tax=Stutzerimonas stutzeri TaxID=316 RepID=UPI00244B63C1|nr:hypothetical protein [Stutzerimonas stutzeri]MDH0100119.1 hypothetical protein [Stutzerimonas stutzeri]